MQVHRQRRVHQLRCRLSEGEDLARVGHAQALYDLGRALPRIAQELLEIAFDT